MDIQSTNETWQVDAGGQTFDTSFEEMQEWIAEGSLLRIDRVRRGNLRWIEAGKVPSLVEFFNAKDAQGPLGPVITTSTTEVLGVAEPTRQLSEATAPLRAIPPVSESTEPVCSVHADIPAVYQCDTCTNLFCKGCPSAYGGNVRICPFCGAMCEPLVKVEQLKAETTFRHQAVSGGFGFSDFGNALAHPFKFKASLILGALMFSLVSVGQGAMSFGGMFMMNGAIFCFMLTNTMTFGILANTVENFAQGKLNENFMPSFDDFSLWDDVVHPFFLMIGVYLSSFGPLIAVGVLAIFMVTGAMNGDMNEVQSDAARTVIPELPYAANSAKQSERVRELLGKTAEDQKRRVESIESGETPQAPPVTQSAAEEAHQFNLDEEQDFEAMQKLIDDQRRSSLESTLGKTPETKAKEQSAMFQKVLGYGLIFILLGGITLLWGVFYYPAACAVAGYTRSFAATMNPTVGFDTIRRLGVDYIKILLMAVVIILMSGTILAVIQSIFSAFDLPGVGNLPAIFFGSFITFYFSIVFSCVLGYALFKAGDRLPLPR